METSEQIERFRDFFESYKERIHEVIAKGWKSVVFEFNEILTHDPELADLLLEDPENLLKAAELSLNSLDLPSDFIKIRFRNLPSTNLFRIRDIRSIHLDRFLAIEGLVRQTSDVRPQVTSAKFECPSCGNTMLLLQIDTQFREPSRCSCGRKGKFRLIHKDLIDAQRIVLEEAPETLEGGEQPKRLAVFLKGDLVDPKMEKRTAPGTKVKITGVVKEVAMPLRTGGHSTRYDIVMDSNYIEPVEETFEEMNITKEEEEEILEASKDPRIYQRLILSIAPSIYGHEDIKAALMLQLMGGVQKIHEDGTKRRGDMHVLLIGDPGVAKSQLLHFISKIAPKARLVSGKGASSAGLTATVVKDEFLRGWALEAGAFVLANGGFCLSEDTKIILADNKVENIKSVCKRIASGEKLLVKSMDESNFELKESLIKKASIRKAEKLYKLVFDTGDELKITGEHPLLKWDNGISWVTVDNLNVGDYIATRKTFPDTESTQEISEILPVKSSDISNKLTEEFMEFMGLIATDGSVSRKKNAIRFYTKSKEIENRYFYLTKKLFNKNPSVYVDKRRDVKQLFFSSKDLCDLICHLGVSRGSKSKMNLDKILSMPNNLIRSFLIGALNGDGSISNRRGGGIIDLVCSSKETAYSYKNLFRKLGIIAKVNFNTAVVNGTGLIRKGVYTTYKVSITGISNISLLNDSRLVSWKFNSLQKIMNRRNTSIRFPLMKDILDKLRKITPHYEKHLFYKESLRTSRLSSLKISREVLARMLINFSDMNPVKNSQEYKLLRDLVFNEMITPKIIEKKEIEGDVVYNIEVEGNHNFFANFILVHNCLIDEMDKINQEDTSALHQALEQQIITISKANIQATLKAQTTLLAAANPKLGRFDPYLPIASQINMPATLINRFDLIFPIRDIPSREFDTRVATHVLMLQQKPEDIKAEFSPEFLKKYISYARQKIKPELTKEAVDEIKEFYVNLRNLPSLSEQELKPIPISARQLEALVRLAEGSARVRLSKKVTKKDSQRAIETLKRCLMQVGFDPESGQLDIDRISTGISASKRSKITKIQALINELTKKVGKRIPIDDLIMEASEQGIDEEQVNEAIEILRRDGTIYKPQPNIIERI